MFGGAAGGALAGFLVAYLEVLFLVLTVGPFWATNSFLLESVALYGLVGAAGGMAGGLAVYAAVFRSRPLRKGQPAALYFGIYFAVALILEILVYLLDIHVFRGPDDRWSFSAYGILAVGVLIAGLAGSLAVKATRNFMHRNPSRRLAGSAAAALILVLVFLVVGRLSGPPPGPAAPRPVNVILIVIDALRADHLSAYGHSLPTSPFLDRLAEEGVLFRDVLAVSNWTVPTHASLFTGLYPSSHGSYSLFSALDPALPSLPRILASRGYRTASLYDNPLVGARFGISAGFKTALGVDNEHKVSLAAARIWKRLCGNRSSTGQILKIAGRWIERSGGRERRPFFLFLNLLDTHLPFRPRQPYLDEFLGPVEAEAFNRRLVLACTTDAINDRKTAESVLPRLTAADWRVLSRYYDANIRAVDEDLRRFFDRLRSGGYLEDTLVIVTADHGELLGEGGGGHSQAGLRNPVLNVPLILWSPGRLRAGEVERPVSQVDLLPTILRLSGLGSAIPKASQGDDLFAALFGRGVLAEAWDENLATFDRAWFVGEYKLVVRASGRRELYDRKKDPDDMRDLSGENPDLLETLAKGLEEKLKSMPKARTDVDPKKRKALERKLRSLGYL